MRFLLLKIIKLYQKTLSLDHGLFKFLKPYGQCKFYPTCSEYSYQAIDKYGVCCGSVKAIWRILHCNPFSKGGLDLLTNNEL